MTSMTIHLDSLICTSPHRFVTEASDIGIRAGMSYPKQLNVEGGGNGQPLYPTKIDSRDGDLISVTYRQQFGCIDIIIFND